MKKIAGYLIAIVLIIATIIFGGWVLNMEYLKRPFDHTKMMNPVTALSMIMACTSYFLLYKRNPGKKTFIAGKVLAFGVFGIALIKLSALTGLQFDLDAWLFDDPILRRSGHHACIAVGNHQFICWFFYYRPCAAVKRP